MNKVILAASIGLLISCNQGNKSSDALSTITGMESKNSLKQEKNIQGPSGRIYIDDNGTGGIPVVFAHSFSGNTLNWQNQLEHLRKNRRAIAFDFRGHGASDSPDDNNYAAEALAGDIAAVVDSLGLEQFVLVGHSMGGSAVIAYTGLHPERVAGLVMAGTPGKSPITQAKTIISSLESDAYDMVMDQYMEQLLTDSKPTTDSLIRSALKKLSKETSLRIIKALFQFDPLPVLEQYEGPKFIIATAREDKQPHALHHQMPRIPRKIIEGTSHWTQMDKPHEFNAVLDDFLKRIESKQQSAETAKGKSE